MKNNKILIPLVIMLSLLLGAGGMYVTIAAIDGDNSSMVLEEADVEKLVEGSENEAVETSSNVEIDLEQVEKIEKAYEIISERYVNEVDSSELIEGAISGMLNSLDDPYSVYMDESTAQEFVNSLDSSFEGIGAEVSMTDGKVTIVAPFRDSPAEDAGLRPNDQIVEIDGEGIDGLSLYDAVLKIRGEKGTSVTLSIERPGVSDMIDIDVVRDEIPIETVYSEKIEQNGKNIGVLEISSFSANTADRFEEELLALEKEGIDGLVIDVRGNPGGFLQSVEDIGNLVIPNGEPIVQIEDREGERLRHISNLKQEKDYPIVTLIDEGSASASEILAAAMKEAGDYEVVGKTTFGKGTVQQTLPMDDGSEIKLTLFRWLTSDGNDINKEGVHPTLEVEQPEYFYVSPLNFEDSLVFDSSSEYVKSAQIMLKGLGEDPGRTDGYFDRQTEKAVSSFQEKEELDITGEINEETGDRLQELLIELIQDRDSDLQFKKAMEILTAK